MLSSGEYVGVSVFEVPCSESGRPKMERLSVEVLNVAELFAMLYLESKYRTDECMCVCMSIL